MSVDMAWLFRYWPVLRVLRPIPVDSD